MTTNSPNPVDGDVQALIADCREEINALIALIERLKKHNVQFDLSKYESQLNRQQVALAALTAEPEYNTSDEYGETYLDVSKERYDECHEDYRWISYPAPPAQILRPVELPGGFSPAIGDIFDRHAPVMRRDKEDGEWLHKVTVAELLRSLGHEVK